MAVHGARGMRGFIRGTTGIRVERSTREIDYGTAGLRELGHTGTRPHTHEVGARWIPYIPGKHSTSTLVYTLTLLVLYIYYILY